MRGAQSGRRPLSSTTSATLRFLLFVFCGFVLAWPLRAEATGFIKIGGRAKTTSAPGEPAEVTIVSESVSVKLVNQMVKTRVVQVFKNNTGRILEGEYIFPLPFGANIVSFSTWDDGVKIDGVILEKARAKKIYDDIVAQAKDPGLLENIGSNTFSAKIFPIPAYGTKRLEMEYAEYLPLQNRIYTFTYPLYSEELTINARALSIEVELTSDFEVVSPQVYFKSVSFVKNGPGRYLASYSSPSFDDRIDFKASFSLDMAKDASKIITFIDKYNDSEEIYFLSSFRPFEIENANQHEGAVSAKARKAVFLIDASYSMRGEKAGIVKKLFSAIRTLEGYDGFNAIFFDSTARVLDENFIAADAAGFARLRSKLDKIKPFGASRPAAAVHRLIEMVEKAGGAEIDAILISDGLYPAFEGGLPLERAMKEAFESSAAAKGRLTLSALAAGASCENDRLTAISNAFMGEFREVKNLYDEQAQLVIPAMLKSMSGGVVKSVQFVPGGGMSAMSYPQYAQCVNFDSECYAVGKLLKPSPIELELEYEFRGKKSVRKITAAPKSSNDWYIPLLWARLRVNYLTAQIDAFGENDQMRAEIVALSKRFNFVTKYTSFLAVPPSVLRPRRIKPGDPEIFVNAPRDSKLVLVKLPFAAEPLKAEYDEAKGAFAARFTAPAHIKDGRYEARVMIVDKFGRETHHALDFFIDSTPPVVYAKCLPERVTPGGVITITANASPDTASLLAKMPDGRIVALKYDPPSKLSTADYRIGCEKPGEYGIEIEAIDHAGNRSVKSVKYAVCAAAAGAAQAPGNNATAGDMNAR